LRVSLRLANIALGVDHGKRRKERNNFQNYTYRPESVHHTTINGNPALSAVADYVMAGQKMVEYLTWVAGETAKTVVVPSVSPALPLRILELQWL
jgi:hypothetical protein